MSGNLERKYVPPSGETSVVTIPSWVNLDDIPDGGNYKKIDHARADELNAVADITATPTAGAIPVADGSGKLTSWVADATTSTKGLVELATDGEDAAGVVVQGNDSRLDNARTPTSHTHAPAEITGTAVVTNDARLSDARTPVSHSHAASDVTGTAVLTNDARLSDTRDPKTHTHAASDVTGTAVVDNDARLTNARTPVAHTHAAADVTGTAVVDNDARLTNARTPSAHSLISKTGHTASGLTSGHFLKATAADEYGFAAHGLGYSDVGAAPTSHTHAASDVTGTAVVDNDARLTDNRHPTSHASHHQNGGDDEVATATAGANAIPKADASGKLDTWVSTATTSVKGIVELASSAETDAGLVVQASDSRLSDTRDPKAHNLISKTGHAVTGLTAGHFLKATAADEYGFAAHGLGYSDVGAAASSHSHAASDVTGTAVVTNDARLSDNRHPTSHASHHQHGGDDEIATATPAANAIPKADADGTLDDWVTPGVAGPHALIDTTGHTASGLTTGHFIKATGATTYGFAAHGLSAADVGASASDHTHNYAGSGSAGGAATSADKVNAAVSFTSGGTDTSFDGSAAKSIGYASVGAAASGHTHSAATTEAAGFESAADKTKLDGIASGATANAKATGAELNTGTDDTKFATAKALADSDYAKTSDAPAAHNLIDTTGHPAAGLTAGHFLKATAATTYAFGAHGLTNTDVGAAAASHAHGNVTSAGAIGSTTDLPVITGASGALTVGSYAAASDLNTGTDATKVVNADALAGSNLGTRIVYIKINDDSTALTVGGNGKAIFTVPTEMTGMNLVAAKASCSTASSGNAVSIMIRNVTDSSDMLSTAITIDSGELNSHDATESVVDANEDDVVTKDEIAVDIDDTGTGVKGLEVVLSFRLP